MAKSEIEQVSRAEMEALSDVPSIFSNKFYITVSAGGVRLTFAEVHVPDMSPRMRVSVTLPHLDAVALRDVLSRMLEQTIKVVPTPADSAGDSPGDGPQSGAVDK